MKKKKRRKKATQQMGVPFIYMREYHRNKRLKAKKLSRKELEEGVWFTFNQLAESMGVSHSTVRTIVKKVGFQAYKYKEELLLTADDGWKILMVDIPPEFHNHKLHYIVWKLKHGKNSQPTPIS